jgi:hypothetical protein
MLKLNLTNQFTLMEGPHSDKQDDETQIAASNPLGFAFSNSADVCSQFMQSVVGTAKELLQPDRIFSFSIQDGKLMCAHETPPPPPRSRADIYQEERERYSKKENKDTIGIAQSLYAPASLKAFLAEVSVNPVNTRRCSLPKHHTLCLLRSQQPSALLL